MARYIPAMRPAEALVEAAMTLTALQLLVGGFIRFVELDSGDLLVVNEASFVQLGYYNATASSIAGRPVYGDAVLCSPREIA